MKHLARRPWTLRLTVVACGPAPETASTLVLVNVVPDKVS